jgi:hypothetical protein
MIIFTQFSSANVFARHLFQKRQRLQRPLQVQTQGIGEERSALGQGLGAEADAVNRQYDTATAAGPVTAMATQSSRSTWIV